MPFHYLGVGGNGYIVQNLDSCIFLVTKDAYHRRSGPDSLERGFTLLSRHETLYGGEKCCRQRAQVCTVTSSMPSPIKLFAPLSLECKINNSKKTHVDMPSLTW